MSSQTQTEKEPVAVQKVEKAEAETQEEKQRAEKISQDELEKSTQRQTWGYCDSDWGNTNII